MQMLMRCLCLQDAFLNSNCLAILMNMAPHLSNIHTYAAQKLVSLFEFLAKRHDLLLQRQADKEKVGSGDTAGMRSTDDDGGVFAPHVCFSPELVSAP